MGSDVEADQASQDTLKAALAEIGAAIRRERQARGWSLRTLAERASVSASLLSAVENGKIVPTVASLFAVAAAFGIPPQHLFPASWREEPAREAAARPTAPSSPPPLTARLAGAESGGRDPHGREVGASAAVEQGQGGAAQPLGRSAERSRARRPVRTQRREPRSAEVGQRLTPARGASGAVSPEPALARNLGSEAEPAPDGDSSEGLTGGANETGQPGARSWDERPRTPSWIVRSSARRSLDVVGGLRMIEVLARREPGIEVLELELPPGASTGSEMLRHSGEDVGLVIAGEIVIERGFERAIAVSGDCIRLDGTYPHRLMNEREMTARLVWITLGPAGPRP